MPAGSVTLQVGVDTTYTIVATNKLSQATATVTIKVKQAPVVPPGQPPIANAGPDFGTLQREFVLDGSGSSDPEGGPLTYRWRSLGTSAVVLDPTSATTRVQIGGPRGAYDFELTVTDSAGNVAVDTVRVQYVGQ
jgi:hypothetical protein